MLGATAFNNDVCSTTFSFDVSVSVHANAIASYDNGMVRVIYGAYMTWSENDIWKELYKKIV